MFRMSLCGPGLAVERLYAHLPHQGTHMLAPDLDAILSEDVSQHADTGKWGLQVQTIDALH